MFKSFYYGSCGFKQEQAGIRSRGEWFHIPSLYLFEFQVFHCQNVSDQRSLFITIKNSIVMRYNIA